MRFLLVDRVLECEPGSSLRARKHVTMESDVFDHHFPGHPVFPGVLIVESLAQASGILIADTARRDGREIVIVLRSIERAAFVRIVRPGDTIDIFVTLESVERHAARTRATATVDGSVAARAALTFGLAEADEVGHKRALERQREIRAALTDPGA